MCRCRIHLHSPVVERGILTVCVMHPWYRRCTLCIKPWTTACERLCPLSTAPFSLHHICCCAEGPPPPGEMSLMAGAVDRLGGIML